MYERFTDRARMIMQLANQEAQRFNHVNIGTEHVLLGLASMETGVAAHLLKTMDIDLRTVRQEVEKLMLSGPEMVRKIKLRQTPRAKKVIEYAMEEARSLGHNYVGSEHILFGMLREQEGVAAQALIHLGVTLERARSEYGILVPDAVSRFEHSDPPRGQQWVAGICILVALAIGAILTLIFIGR